MATKQNKIWLTIACLHISAVLYVLVGILVLVIFMNLDDGDAINTPLGVFGLIFSLAIAAGVEVIVYGLKQRKFWGWVAGLATCGVYTPSLFFPLGALGLWGLLDEGSRAEFGMGPLSEPRSRRTPTW